MSALILPVNPEVLTCRYCKLACDLETSFEVSRGSVCFDCAESLCEDCHDGECEVELRDGRYVCVDCYSGRCSDAYDRLKERD